MLLYLPWVRQGGALMEVFYSNKAKPKKAWYDVNLDCCPWHSNRHVLDPRHQVVSISPGSSRSDEAVLAPELLWPLNTCCIYIHKYRCMYRPHLISHHIRTYTVYIYTYTINQLYIYTTVYMYIYIYLYIYIYYIWYVCSGYSLPHYLQYMSVRVSVSQNPGYHTMAIARNDEPADLGVLFSNKSRLCFHS